MTMFNALDVISQLQDINESCVQLAGDINSFLAVNTYKTKMHIGFKCTEMATDGKKF